MIEVYVDGACSGNPGPGASAFCIVKNDNIVYERADYLENTTNNICELLGLIYGIDSALFRYPNEELVVYSDSAYCVSGYNEWIYNWQKNGWLTAKKEEVKNRELWEKLVSFTNNKQIKVVKVKGHAGNKFNNHVDRLAVDAYKNM